MKTMPFFNICNFYYFNWHKNTKACLFFYNYWRTFLAIQTNWNKNL